MYYIGVDIGGTNLVVGVLDDNKNIIFKSKCKTNVPRSGRDICDDIRRLIENSLKSVNVDLKDVHSIGLGCPGAVNTNSGVIEYSPNLFLENFELRNEMAKFFSKKIFIGNDANLAALGEYIQGAAQHSSTSITLTIGTGIGTGVIIGGKIYTGFNYMAGETGHMVIYKNGRRCACGRRGCFETYASARGLVRTTKEILSKFDRDSTIMWDMVDGYIEKVSGRTAFTAMKQQDLVAKQVVDAYIADLACGVTNLVNMIQPEVLCIGGGLSNEGDFLLDPLREIVYRESYNSHSSKKTSIVKAQLGNDAGIIGAALQGVKL